MRLFPFAIAIFLLVAACVPAEPMVSVAPAPPGLKRLGCDPTAFTGRVVVLPPASQSQLQQPAAAAIVTDLGNAYCNAPEIFRHRLDQIDYVFLDATQCTGGNLNQCLPLSGAMANRVSWGKRGKAGYTEIGIPAGLWAWSQGVAQPAETYASYETEILNSLIRFDATPPTFSAPAGSPGLSSWMTVLAAIAHEVGHVRWFELNAKSGIGSPYDFKRLNDCGFFLGWQSKTPKTLAARGRWRGFGERSDTSNENQNDHAQAPTFNNEYRNANTDQLRGMLLNALYSGGQPWTGFFGANATDEDFVESYKFWVLINSGLASLQITIPFGNGPNASQQDIPSDYTHGNKQLLVQKVACLSRWI